VEIMGASDNVVRGGTTVKHVDVDELLRVVDITPLADPRTPATPQGAGAWSYDTPSTPFRLWRYEIEGSFAHTATGRELLLCIDGTTDHLDRGATAYLSPGERVDLRGRATLFRVEERPTA
jgi:mannose-6-phosphate isomerase